MSWHKFDFGNHCNLLHLQTENQKLGACNIILSAEPINDGFTMSAPIIETPRDE